MMDAYLTYTNVPRRTLHPLYHALLPTVASLLDQYDLVATALALKDLTPPDLWFILSIGVSAKIIAAVFWSPPFHMSW